MKGKGGSEQKKRRVWKRSIVLMVLGFLVLSSLYINNSLNTLYCLKNMPTVIPSFNDYDIIDLRLLDTLLLRKKELDSLLVSPIGRTNEVFKEDEKRQKKIDSLFMFHRDPMARGGTINYNASDLLAELERMRLEHEGKKIDSLLKLDTVRTLGAQDLSRDSLFEVEFFRAFQEELKRQEAMDSLLRSYKIEAAHTFSEGESGLDKMDSLLRIHRAEIAKASGEEARGRERIESLIRSYQTEIAEAFEEAEAKNQEKVDSLLHFFKTHIAQVFHEEDGRRKQQDSTVMAQVFNNGEVRKQKQIVNDRWIGFLLGIIGSLIATCIFPWISAFLFAVYGRAKKIIPFRASTK